MIRCTKRTNIVQLNNCHSTDTPRILGHLISAAPIATAKNQENDSRSAHRDRMEQGGN